MCYSEYRDDPYLDLVRALYGADGRLFDRRAESAEHRLAGTVALPEDTIRIGAPGPAAAQAATDGRITRDTSF